MYFETGSRNQLITTLRQSFLQLENSILPAFMHVNWPQMRKAWTAAVSSSTTARDFARAIIALQACIKPVVYASVWHDQLGEKLCLTLFFSNYYRNFEFYFVFVGFHFAQINCESPSK